MKRIVIDARESGTSTGRYIDKLVEYIHIVRPKYEITLLAKPHRVDFLRRVAPTYQVDVCHVKEFTFAEQTTLREQIDKLQADLVFFPAVQQPVLYRGLVVTTMQDLTTIRFRNPSKNWLVFTIKRGVYKRVNRRVVRRSAQLITPSEFVKQDIVHYCGADPKKITVTHEAADAIPDPAKPLALLTNQRFIMYVGRPMPHKNLPRLIAAFNQLQLKSPDLHLVLAGKKDVLYQQIADHVAAHGIKNVIFTDFVSEGELRWLYENTAAYVFPSLSEGFGLPGLEAMVHGAPVVSSSATCLPEVYQDGALYFDPLDVVDMAAKIRQVIDDPSLAKDLASKGREVAVSYSWRRMAQQTLAVFAKALDKN